MDLYREEYSEGATTFEYSLGALFNMFASSPIGEQFGQRIEMSKNTYTRNLYDDLSREALAYSLYKYAEQRNITSFRVADLYNPDTKSGVYREFGISKMALEKLLRSLNSETKKVVNADLNMGLDHISLVQDMDSVKALSALV